MLIKTLQSRGEPNLQPLNLSAPFEDPGALFQLKAVSGYLLFAAVLEMQHDTLLICKMVKHRDLTVGKGKGILL